MTVGSWWLATGLGIAFATAAAAKSPLIGSCQLSRSVSSAAA